MEHHDDVGNISPDDTAEHSEHYQTSPSPDGYLSETERLLEESFGGERDISEMLQTYLKSLGHFGSKKRRRRCISQDLG